MKKQMINMMSSFVMAAFLLTMLACQQPAADNKNAGNMNSVTPVSNSNTNSTNSGAGGNSNVAKPVSESTANDSAVEKTAGDDSASEKKSDEKLAQRIIGLWEGKNPTGQKIGLDFRADNKVYPVDDSKEGKPEKPATYKVVDEENVELTTPDAKPETWTIKVKGDKMTIDAGGGKLEFTKAK